MLDLAKTSPESPEMMRLEQELKKFALEVRVASLKEMAIAKILITRRVGLSEEQFRFLLGSYRKATSQKAEVGAKYDVVLQELGSVGVDVDHKKLMEAVSLTDKAQLAQDKDVVAIEQMNIPLELDQLQLVSDWEYLFI